MMYYLKSQSSIYFNFRYNLRVEIDFAVLRELPTVDCSRHGPNGTTCKMFSARYSTYTRGCLIVDNFESHAR